MKIEQLIRETYNLAEQAAELTNKYNANRKKIQEHFDEKQIKKLIVNDLPDSVGDNGASLTVTKIETVTIDYFVDKLQESLSKDIFNEIVNKYYSIKNINGLIELLRKANIKPSEFKEFIDVKITPNKEAINQLYSVGDITKNQLKGCYSAKITKSIRIQKGKGDTD